LPESNVIPTSSARPALARDGRSIGAVLVDAGRLRIEDVERILRLQREKKLRFGDAATQLGLLTQADIDFALSRQFDFPYLRRGESTISEEVVAAYAPFPPQVEALRALRSQLMLRWFDTGPAHKALAVVSAERKEGRSFIAANLAVVFSQLGERTLLIDADMRNPCQHRLFGIDNRAGLSAVLAGRAGPDAVQRVAPLRNLSVLSAGALPPNPQELLARPHFPQLLQQLAPQLDVILLDSPAASETADAQIIAVRTGAALIVARKDTARKWHVQGVSDTVAQARATIVGAVLNSY
jgi:protein-tyrosine kinase